jgi:hypothetical protein
MGLCFDLIFGALFLRYKAGKKTTDEELEEMLESGNPAIFTSGVSDVDTVNREGSGTLPALAGWVVVAGRQVWLADGLCLCGLL